MGILAAILRTDLIRGGGYNSAADVSPAPDDGLADSSPFQSAILCFKGTLAVATAEFHTAATDNAAL